MKKHVLLAFILNVFLFNNVFAAGGINTGNGTIPFGQNTRYQYGIMPTNLPNGGTYGASQKAADAYEAWKNAYVESCGSGRYRVKFDDVSYTVSEGIAYGMLLAVYADDKDLFDGLWAYYKANMNGNGVMNWKINGCSVVAGQNGSTDAELDVAMALIIASEQWSNGDYVTAAKSLIQTIKSVEMSVDGQVLNGDAWGSSNTCRNPSYFAPAYYKEFAKVDINNASFWSNTAITAANTILLANRSTTSGLVSNWCDSYGSESTCGGAGSANGYGTESCRNPWRMAVDYLWHGDDASSAAKDINAKLINFINGCESQMKGPLSNRNVSNPSGGLYMNGSYTTFALPPMTSSSAQSSLNKCYSSVANIANIDAYFNSTIRCITLFVLTGNFWAPGASNLSFPPSVSSAETDENGLYLTLMMSESMSEGTSSGSNFSVYYNDSEQVGIVSEVNINNDKTIVLTLSTAPRYNQTIHLSYNGAGDIKSLDNVELEVFTKIEVQNNVELIETTSIEIQPISNEILEQHNLSANINPLEIPIASGAVGDTLYLNAIVTPDNATYPTVTWSSSDENIASVDSIGCVIGVGDGTATITARSKMYPDVFATYSVTVPYVCTPPADFNILCDDASLYTGDSIYICENNAQCTLTTDEWASSGNNFEYIWYKDGVAGTSSVANTSAAYSVTGAGVYKILVCDKNAPNATSCQLEKSVTVFLNPLPTVTVAGGGEICEGEELLNPVTFTMTGEPRFRVYWDFTDQTGTTKTNNKRSRGYIVEVDTPTEVGEYTYTVKSIIDDANCKNEQVRGTATITIKPIPSVEITTLPEPEVCEGEVVVLTASSDQTGVSYAWKGRGNGSGAIKTLDNPNESGTYNVTASLNGCSSEAVSVDVTIHEKPEITSVTSEMSSVCSGETITMTATTNDEGNGTFLWSGNGVTGNGATATMSNIVTDDTEITITSNYTSMYGCDADPKTLDLIVYAIPESPTVYDVSYYENARQSDVVALIAMSSKNGTLYWYGKNATGGVGSTIAPTPQIMDGTSTYYVSQKVNGCESERVPLTVTIMQAPIIVCTRLPEVDITNGESLPTITLSDYFTVEDQTISYTVTSSDNSVVYPVIIGDKLELIQYGAGTATIEISASVDESFSMVTNWFTVTIEPNSQSQLCDLSIEPDITNVTCFGGKDGKIEISVSNGAEPYHFKWNTGRTSNGIYDVPAGEYSVLVWDSVGCTATKIFQIEEPAEIVAVESITTPSCGQSNGAISIEISGGTAPYSQIWSLANSDAT